MKIEFKKSVLQREKKKLDLVFKKPFQNVQLEKRGVVLYSGQYGTSKQSYVRGKCSKRVQDNIEEKNSNKV